MHTHNVWRTVIQAIIFLWVVFESSGGDTCLNPSTWKPEKGGSWLWGQSGLHSGILSKNTILADLPGPWRVAYTVHTSMSLFLCLRCRIVGRSLWACLTAARGLSESLKETMGSTIADLFISCFVLCYLLVLGFVYISNLFILENIDADGQGFCQGGFSIDFTKVSSHSRQIQIFFTDSTGFKNTRSLL